MLYDPKWEKKAKSELSLAGLIAWLETQDPKTEYEWFGCTPCLVEQYAAACGFSRDDLYCVKDERGFNAYDRIACDSGLAVAKPHTFGAALDRARRTAAG
jgi:hypothetical protein